MQKLKVVSLFAGCGGADLGIIGGFRFLGKQYKKLPFEIIHASDIDAAAVETYNQNFSHKAEVADVKKLNFMRGSADVVIGGFPCQSFSTVNPTKNPDSKETQLFWEMARVIRQVKPKAFIAENVRGFYTLSEGKYFNLAKEAFEKAGYVVYHNLFNAAELGVPQKRVRLIMVGIRKDLAKDARFVFPTPQHGPASRRNLELVPLSAVIDSLVPDDPKYYFSKKAVQGARNAKPNMKRALAQDLSQPCLTITSHLAKVSINSRDPVLLVDPKRDLYRRFTPREAASIQSFPRSFKFAGSDSKAYRQIGNAVPPVLMWWIAQSLATALQNAEPALLAKTGSASRRQLELGI